MKKSQVPFYNDPTDFGEKPNLYPCDTQFMVYDPLLHKYFLTQEALNVHGIDVERQYISQNANKMQEFLRIVTDTVYDYIQYKAGWKNFQVMLYRIAVCPNQIYQDPYAFRKQFEEVLLIQAQYLIENGCSANYSGVNLARGKRDGVPPENEFRDNSSVSPRAINKLEFMGLTRWFTLPQLVRLDIDKY